MPECTGSTLHNDGMTEQSKSLSSTAFATLLLIAFMMGANHVAARFAFNDGVDVVTAVTFRSVLTAIVVGLILWQQKVQIQVTAHHKKYMLIIGALIAVQSVCLYSSVARLPVALALLAFNTYPLSTAFWARVLYGHQPEKAVLWSMPILLLGLALALDVMGAASGLGAAEHWSQIGSGVAFALAASATFGLALVYTQHETTGLDGRLRTFSSMSIVGVFAVVVAMSQGGFHLPQAPAGWWGLGMLSFLYGTAFTIMFTVLPRLGVVGNSPILNIEPVVALVLAWLLLCGAPLLALLATRLPTVDEIVGAAGVMRARVERVPCATDPAVIVDTAGTGGAPKSFNVSTAAAIVAAVSKARRHASLAFVMVEVDTAAQFNALLTLPRGVVDAVLLDNMTPAVMRRLVARRDRRAPWLQLEASGGINVRSVGAVARSGVDFISSGAITHSAPQVDFGLDITRGAR